MGSELVNNEIFNAKNMKRQEENFEKKLVKMSGIYKQACVYS